MTFNINKLARLTEFSIKLASLGSVIIVSLNFNHLSEMEKKLATNEVKNIYLVRWLFGEMARRPIKGSSCNHDPANNARLDEADLSAVQDDELNAFAEALVQKNNFTLLKQHKYSTIKKVTDESSCDFLIRALQHHVKELRISNTKLTTSHLNAYPNMAALAAMKHIRSNGVQTALNLMEAADFAAIDRVRASASFATERTLTTTFEQMSQAQLARDLFQLKIFDQKHLGFTDQALWSQANGFAEQAQAYALHASLEPYRTAKESLANRLLIVSSLDLFQKPAYLQAFTQTAAISNLLASSPRIDHHFQDAIQAYTQTQIPDFNTLRAYGDFLNSAGLALNHWPHRRLLSIGEKRQRLKIKLSEHSEPPQVKKGMTLARRYELVLRDILDAAMMREYGTDWAADRLPACGCKDLLGKWKNKGGEVLDHADYAHYRKIMCYPAHFEDLFSAGFDDPLALEVLLDKAKKHRVALVHCYGFLPEDLLDLRLTWKTIESGLLFLTDDYGY
jgi:hypothetical protein